VTLAPPAIRLEARPGAANREDGGDIMEEPHPAMSQLRVGLALPGSERPVRWPECLAIAQAAEELGFDSIRAGDHVLYRADHRPERGPLEVWTLIAALSAVTSRIRLGPLVACTAFHPPGLIAKMAATIDEISLGRLILGLGAGWYTPEFLACGLPATERAGRFAESFEIIWRLLAGERVSLRGQYWGVDDLALKPAPQRRIPLLIGSVGERVLAISLPHVDWWHCDYANYQNSAAAFAEQHARVGELAQLAGREPGEIAASASVLVDDTQPGIGSGQPAQIRALTHAELPGHLGALAAAGADEAILVLRPCTEATVRAVGSVLKPTRPTSLPPVITPVSKEEHEGRRSRK
jgi:Luciferase-like monooxygenase